MNYITKPIYFVLFLVLGVLISINSKGQAGWKWGRDSKIFSLGYFEGTSVAIDTSGNSFLTGIGQYYDSSSFGPFILHDDSGLYKQLIVSKVDSTGNFQWVIGTHNSDFPIGGYIATDLSGNLYLLTYSSGDTCRIDTCTVISDSSGGGMGFIAKISSSGHVIWAKNIAHSSYILGDIGTGISVDNAGFIYVTGTFIARNMLIGSTSLSNIDTIGDSSDIFIAKFDSLGNNVWAKSFGSHGNDNSNGITTTKNGISYIYGNTTSPTLDIGSTSLTTYVLPHNFLASLDSSGNFIWANNISQNVNVSSSTSDINNNLFLTGNIDANVILGPDTLTRVGINNPLIMKYNPGGSILWARSGIGYGNYLYSSVTADHCGKLFYCGEFSFCPGIDTSMLFNGHKIYPPHSSFDPMFIAEYDTSGNYISCNVVPTGGDDFLGITCDNRGNFFVGGDFATNYFYVGPDSLFRGDSADEQLFIAKYKYDSFQCSGYCIPPPITGFSKVCIGLTDSLDDVECCGRWSSSNSSIATVDSFTGVITGLTLGSVVITYLATTRCFITKTITVTTPPLPLSEPSILCVGSMDTLSDPIPGGNWMSSNPFVATIGSNSGIVNGISAGVTIISYSFGGSCFVNDTVTINPLPDIITGSTHLCLGDSLILHDSTPGGFWSSSNLTISSVGYLSGLVHSISVGVDTITYSLSSGCKISKSDTIINCTALSTNIIPKLSIALSPNPTYSTLTITSTTKISQITITNLLGQTLLSRNYNSEQVVVDVANLPPGVYLLRINGNEVRKFVKE